MRRYPAIRAFGLALFLLATTALAAGRVVVLDFTGDRHNRLHTQLEAALRHAHVSLVPAATYKKAAAKEGLTGARAQTPTAIRKVAPALEVSLVVTGAVASSFYVRFLDRFGQELWSHELPIRKGRVSAANASKLAKAISAGVRQADAALEHPHPRDDATVASEGGEEAGGAGSAVTGAPGEGESASSAAGENDGAPDAGPASSAVADGSGADGSAADGSHVHGAGPEGSNLHGAGAAGQDAPREGPQGPNTLPGVGSPSAGSSLPPGALAPAGPASDELVFVPRPPTVRVLLLASSTFRSYCARPGVESCGDYDAQDPTTRAGGPTVDFSPQVPYTGFDLGLELFPLAQREDAFRGLGISGELHRGFELTQVRQDGTQTRDTRAKATDLGFRVEALWRWYFAPSSSRPLAGYLGGRVGYLSRAFEVDKSIAAILPGAHQRGPILGVDAAYPFRRWLRLEGSVELYPHLSPGSDETVGFGTRGTGFGYGAQLGPAGELWGPLGYTVRARIFRLTDTFEGQGVSWAAGGVAQETYLVLQAGLTLRF